MCVYISTSVCGLIFVYILDTCVYMVRLRVYTVLFVYAECTVIFSPSNVSLSFYE